MQTIPNYGFLMSYEPNEYESDVSAYNNYMYTKSVLENNFKDISEILKINNVDDATYVSPIRIKGKTRDNLVFVVSKVGNQININIGEKEGNFISCYEEVSESVVKLIEPKTWERLKYRIENGMTIEKDKLYVHNDIHNESEKTFDKVSNIKNEKIFGEQDVYSLLHMLKNIEGDNVTYEHSIRVGENIGRFVKDLGYSDREANTVRLSGYLHDIGKLFIDKNILNAPRALTKQERAHIQSHTTRGVEFLRDLNAPTKYQMLALLHHQPLNAYPLPEEVSQNAFNNDKVFLLAQMANIVDVYDARINKRQYHEGVDSKEIIDSLRYSFILNGLDTSLIDKFESGLDRGIYDFTHNVVEITESRENKFISNKKYSYDEYAESLAQRQSNYQYMDSSQINDIVRDRVENKVYEVCSHLDEEVRRPLVSIIIKSYDINQLDKMSSGEIKDIVIQKVMQTFSEHERAIENNKERRSDKKSNYNIGEER